jgi:hypothetical protein
MAWSRPGFNHLCSMKCSTASLNKSAPPECPQNPPARPQPPGNHHSKCIFSTPPMHCECQMCEFFAFPVTNLSSKWHVRARERRAVRTKISLCCCRRAHTREYREKSVHPARQRRSAASRGLFSVINIIGNYKYSPSDYISRQRQFSGALTTPSLFLFIHFSPGADQKRLTPREIQATAS